MDAALAMPTRRHPFDEALARRRCASPFELRFAELFNAGRGFAFPCDAKGNVDIDQLTERARANYFYARTTIGREFCSPVMCTIAEARQWNECERDDDTMTYDGTLAHRSSSIAVLVFCKDAIVREGVARDAHGSPWHFGAGRGRRRCRGPGGGVAWHNRRCPCRGR